MTPAQHSRLAGCLLDIRLLSELAAEHAANIPSLSDAEYEALAGYLDATSAAAARVGLIMAEASPDFPETMQRAAKAKEARAQMLTQDGGPENDC